MLKISKKTMYGLRAMVDLALKYGQGPVLLKDIAQSAEITIRFLEQIMIQLKAGGLVQSSRGAKGGYQINGTPANISTAKIIQALEGSWSLADCIDDQNCPRQETCPNQEVWKNATRALSDIFENTTLEDLIKRHLELAQKKEKKLKANENWFQNFYKEGK